MTTPRSRDQGDRTGDTIRGLVRRALGPALVGAAGVLVASAAWTGVASAKAGYDSAYGYERTWNSAVRFVRVDEGFHVTEKDEAGGYLMFEYHSPESGTKPSPGSIEVIRPSEPDKPARVLVQLPQMPRYHEQVLLDAFVQKLKTEYGEPPPPRAKPPVVVAPADAGAPDAEPSN